MNLRRLSLGALLLLTGCAPTFLDPAGPAAQAEATHFWIVIALTMVVIIPIYVAIPVFLHRYRLRNPKGQYAPDWEFDWRLEALAWGVPAVIVIILSVLLWGATHDLDPYKPVAGDQPPVEVEAVALDWKWLFIYPQQGVASVNRLVIPKGRPVHIRLTSATVMQSFMVPRLAGQIYAMTDMTTELNLRADKLGRYTGYNTQYNGLSFHRQHFTVDAVKAGEFSQWISRASQSAPLTKAYYQTKLATRGTVSGTPSFKLADPNLFQQVAMKDMSKKMKMKMMTKPEMQR